MDAVALFGDLRSYRRDGMKMEGQGEDRDKQQDTDPTAQLENVHTGLFSVHRACVLITHRCSLVKLVYGTLLWHSMAIEWNLTGEYW